ncbi:MAG: tryptophan synthase subunit alpha [Planctomycetota bacterium]
MTAIPLSGAKRVSAALRAPSHGRPALVAYLTAGFPAKESFARDLLSIAGEADVVEIGVPFSDPLADGVTIQRASRVALENGVTLRWILEELSRLSELPRSPLILMSYLNPLLSFGYERLAADSARAGVAGFVVPDLPLEESAPLRAALDRAGLALVQLVSPVSPPERAKMLCEASTGFVYAVTMTGTTGGSFESASIAHYLDTLRSVSPLPVCAGFGIRSRDQVAALAAHVDGVVVGSALVEAIERGVDPAAILRGLRAG